MNLWPSINIVTMIRFRDQLYMFQELGQVQRYDPKFNGWSLLHLNVQFFDYLTTVRGELYSGRGIITQKMSKHA